MNAGQILGTMNGQQVIGLDIVKHVFQMHTANMDTGEIVIDARTLQRWNAQEGLTKGDGRPAAVRPIPAHALSEDERAKLLSVANEARFCAVPPARIVPMLADEGVYPWRGGRVHVGK